MAKTTKKTLSKTKENKYVYFFGGGKADGKADMKNLLGGKGANLAEMVNIGLPVPAGFTITTEVCTAYYENNKKYPKELISQVEIAHQKVEKLMGMTFGDKNNPLLVSVRSGARSSMPGMMDTVLNVGLNDITREGLIKKTKNPRFVYDSQRRLIQMYADVVMEKAAGIEPKEGHKILDVGSGSGWTTALFAYVVGEEGKVIAIERKEALKNNSLEAVKLMAGTVPMLVLAGLIEGFISPSGINQLYKFGFGILTIILMVLYFGFTGREKNDVRPKAVP